MLEQSVEKRIDTLRRSFDSGVTRPMAWRKEQLRQLKQMLREREADWLKALRADVGKPATEGWLTDIGAVNAEIDHLLRHLDGWARPHRVHVPLRLGLGGARIVPQPLGVVLVIGPWNYPVNLLLLPVAFALSAGNAVVAKPSEQAPTVSEAMARLVPEYLDADAVTVVEGGPEVTNDLLADRWGHVFFTGSSRVGKLVMEAAARNLVPVTLELGGKSPVIVDHTADLDVAARRIAWGKFLNAGQTCLAPDYVLVEREVEEALLTKLAACVREFYGDDPLHSEDYARIVNHGHVARLSALLEATPGGRLVVGGQVVARERYISPTVVRDVSWDEPLMAEEIFGPILPVLSVPDMDAAVEAVNAHASPLALYVFTNKAAVAQKIVERTSSGGVCINGTVLQVGLPGLPFGGVGASGMGSYHGRFGFDAFSHQKAVLNRTVWPDPPITYPPYTKAKDRILRWLF